MLKKFMTFTYYSNFFVNFAGSLSDGMWMNGLGQTAPCRKT